MLEVAEPELLETKPLPLLIEPPFSPPPVGKIEFTELELAELSGLVELG